MRKYHGRANFYKKDFVLASYCRWGGVGSRQPEQEVESSHPEPQTQNKERELKKMFENVNSHSRPPVMYFLTKGPSPAPSSQSSTTNWTPSVQMSESMPDISHSNSYTGEDVDVKRWCARGQPRNAQHKENRCTSQSPSEKWTQQQCVCVFLFYRAFFFSCVCV